MDLTDHRNPLVRQVAELFPEHCALPVERRVSFPGLSACDTAVLCEALRADGVRAEAWWIEAPVGEMPDWATSGTAPGWWKSFAWQYQLRCDMVQVQGDQVFVTEIKGEIRGGAVGQVLTYTFLLQRQLGARVAVQPSLLGRSCIREVREFCLAVGIYLRTLDEFQ